MTQSTPDLAPTPDGGGQLRALLEASKHGMVFITPDGERPFRNHRFAAMLGYTPEEVEALSFPEDFVTPEDVSQLVQGPLETGSSLIHMVRKDGERVAISLDVSEVMHEGQLLGHVAEFRDATAELVAQRAHEESEARLQAVLDASQSGLSFRALDGSGVERNRAHAEMLGYQPEEMRALRTRDMFAPYEIDRVRAWREAVGRGEWGDRQFVVDFLHRDGGIVSVVCRTSPVEVGGEVIGWVTDTRDVTKELAARERLEASETQLARGQAFANVGTWSIELATGEQQWTDELYRLYGLEPGSIAPEQDSVLRYMHPADRERLLDSARRAVESGEDRVDLHVRTVGADDVPRTLWIRSELTRNAAGEPVRWEGANQDVTDELATRLALEDSEARLARGQAFAHVGTSTYWIETGERLWTDETYRLLGLEPGAIEPGLIEPSFEAMESYIDARDLARFQAAFGAAEQGDGKVDEHIRVNGADGITRAISLHAELTSDGDGRPLRWDMALHDVSGTVHAQDELAERERFLSSTLEAVQTGIVVSGRGPDARIISANRQAAEILGYSSEELEGIDLATLVAEEDQAELMQRRRARAEGLMGPVRARYRARRKDGDWIEIESQSAPLIRDGEFQESVASIRDVTEETTLQREVQANAERLSTVFETVSTGLLVIGADMCPITANQAACMILGYSHDQLMTKMVSDFGDPVEAQALVDEVLASIERRRTVTGIQTRAQRGDGIWIDIELTTAPFEVGAELVGVLCEIRDVTTQNAAERQLSLLHSEVEIRSSERQALVQQLLTAQEEERRTVAYEIHDGPAQQLAAAQMFLEAFGQEPALNDIDQTYLSRARTELSTSLGEVRRIMSGLRPALLDELGLGEALRKLLTDLTSRAGVELELELQPAGTGDGLPPEIEISIYRIAQEAAGNALKHSGTPRLKVGLVIDSGTAELTVQDEGAGFDPQTASRPSDGMHFGLVGMRERVELLGGRFDVRSVPAVETTVTATIPLNGGRDQPRGVS